MNETPSFTKGANQTHAFNTTGAQTITNWATAINDGDSTVTQGLTFTVTQVSNTGINFAVAPAVSSSGTLTYSLVQSQGTATFNVSLTDDNSLEGAALTSATQTFTITVLPPAPEIEVLGPDFSTPIADGDTTPSAAKGTQFGQVAASLARTFYIKNWLGSATLNISSIQVTGDNASEFVVSGAPSSIEKSATGSFTVTYTPSSGTALSRATIIINNNDFDEAAYDFLIEGEKAPAPYNPVWSPRSAAGANWWNSVSYGGGQFVAVASTTTFANQVMTSPDGTTWTARNAAAIAGWTSVTYGGGQFVAVARSGSTQVMTSPNGANWTARSAPAGTWGSITYGNGLFVAVADSGATQVMTSPDGINWTTRNAPQANWWISVTYGNGRFVAVANTGTNRVMTSTDGVTWTSAPTTLSATSWQSVTYGNGRFVAVGSSGTQRAATSVDGLTWTAQSSPPALLWSTLTYGSGLFVACAIDGTDRVMTSPDGVTWTVGNTTPASYWRAVTYGQGRFIAVSNTDQVMISAYPEVAVTGNAAAIVDGATTPTVTNHTHFGQTANAVTRTFTVTNTGGIPLTISSITATGPDASRFVVSGAPSSIAADSASTFTVTFTPLPGAISRATITLNNNDPDEAAYDFAVEGSFTLPTVTSVLPSEGTTAGGTGLTITGTGFGGDTTVTIGGVAATGVNVYSPTLLTCLAPAGVAGAKSVVVTTAVGANAANSLYTHLTTTPGSIQALNAAVVGGSIFATITQADGKIVIAGNFSQVLGATRNYLARLNADGSLDASFNPNPDQTVWALAQQPDGKLLLAGNFTSIQSNTRNCIARLNTDGSLDSFDPNPNTQVQALCLQPDGKILIGGAFTTVKGTPRNRLARLNADGSLDATFSPTISGPVYSLALDASGNVLVAGFYSSVQSTGASSATTYANLVRLNPTGVLDSSFRPQPDNATQTVIVLPDGKILLGGTFTSLQPNGAASPTARNYLARLNTDGTLDSAFAPNVQGSVQTLALQADGKLLTGGSGGAGVKRWLANGAAEDTSFSSATNGNVFSLALQPDGRVLIGGLFTTINGAARNLFARLNNDVATNTLTVPNLTQVVWVRGGSAPELSQVTIEQSTSGGVSWSSLGTPVRVAGTSNWQITGLNLPNGVQLRARGRTFGGYYNSSSSVVEQVASFTNATPADIALGAASLAENNAPNATVGTFTTTDANSGDLFTYTLVSGTGSTDNASFTISGNTLRLTPVADFESKASYAVRVRSTDAGGQFFEKAFTVTITNVNELPSFTKGADISLPHSTSTVQTVNGWATAINDGDATVTQSLSFSVSVTSGASLFTTAPVLSSTGVLTFRPNGTPGTATVQITLTDDATLGSPALTSAAQTFNITVAAPPLVPFLGSISPATGTSVGGTTVTIAGNNFGAVNGVSFGGTPATSFTVNSATSISAVTPAGTPGAANLTVTTSDGTSATNPLFTYFAPTSTTLTSGQNPSTFVTPPTFTARATSSQPGLTGQMELFIDNVLFEAKPVDANGFATFTPSASALLSGTRVLRAVYNANGAVATYGTSSATLNQNVQRASVPLTLTGLAQTYDGSPKPVGATFSIPSGYTASVTYTYAGSSTAPTNAGSYPVVATLDHPQFFGSAAGTLVVAPAAITLSYLDTLQAYDGTPRSASFATFPVSLPATITYQALLNGVPNGSPSSTAPTAAGRYRLAVMNSDPNYLFANNTGELYVTKRGVGINLGNLYVFADGQSKPVTVTTTPAGVAVNVFYASGNFSTSAAPSLPPAGGGAWRVTADVVDWVSNVGSATGDLIIDTRKPAPITLTADATANPYDGATVIATVPPVRTGVAPTGTVIMKVDGTEFYRAKPYAHGVAPVAVKAFPVRTQPYLLTAEYTGDDNYLPNVSNTCALTMIKKIIDLGSRAETKTFDGRHFKVSYTGRLFDGKTVDDSQITYNGSSFGPKDAMVSTPIAIKVTTASGDWELRETINLTINRRPSNIRLGNLVQTLRPTLNHKPDVIVDPAGAPFLISFNGNTFTPEQMRVDNPGTYAVRAWISDPNYISSEATDTFVLSQAPVGFTIGNLAHIYDGGAKSVSITATRPLPYTVTYNGSNEYPTAPGYYTVRVTPNISGYGDGTSATMSIASRINATSRADDGSTGFGRFELKNADGGLVAKTFPANVVPDASFGSPKFSYGRLEYIPFEDSYSRTRFAYWENIDDYTRNYNPLQIYFSTRQPPGAYNLTARYFEEHWIVPTSEGNGTVSSEGWFKVGDVATFTAKPATGQIVDRWTYNGQTVGTSSELRVKIVPNGGNPKAFFAPGYFAIARPHPWYAADYNTEKIDYGTASFIRAGRSDLPALSAGYVPLSSNFTATAVPKPGFVFDYWELTNARPANPIVDSVNRPTANFRPIDASKDARAQAHFYSLEPKLDVWIEDRGTRVPFGAPALDFSLKIDNVRGPVSNVRVHLVEVTGFRAIVPNVGDQLNYYYPSPRNQQEIDANKRSLLTAAQRTALDNLGPIKLRTNTLETRSLNLGDIPAKTVAKFKPFSVGWKSFYLTSPSAREEMRITVHIVADRFAQSYDYWRPLYWPIK